MNKIYKYSRDNDESLVPYGQSGRFSNERLSRRTGKWEGISVLEGWRQWGGCNYTLRFNQYSHKVVSASYQFAIPPIWSHFETCIIPPISLRYPNRINYIMEVMATISNYRWRSSLNHHIPLIYRFHFRKPIIPPFFTSKSRAHRPDYNFLHYESYTKPESSMYLNTPILAVRLPWTFYSSRSKSTTIS